MLSYVPRRFQLIFGPSLQKLGRHLVKCPAN
jgi:hypothetical protein